MKIAFYSPLKPPGHPVPSGDRLMARLIIQCLMRAGHSVEVASNLRAFLPSGADQAGFQALSQSAAVERHRLTALWQAGSAPHLWFCYHPYYKAPDLIGPELCTAFGIPYVTAEASYSQRRNIGCWRAMQAGVLQAVNRAAVNICLTARDRLGLEQVAPQARFANLRPFIDTTAYARLVPVPQPFQLICVAMMRAGDKFDSYAGMAAALALVPELPWTLEIIGDGPLNAEVQALFAGFAPQRLRWHGQLDNEAIAQLLTHAAIYVWPGCGEAYGLAYLEAQAAGLPVLAYQTAGVPEVVDHGLTGILTPPGDAAAFAGALRQILTDAPLRERLARNARERVTQFHSVAPAAATLDVILRGLAKGAT